MLSKDLPLATELAFPGSVGRMETVHIVDSTAKIFVTTRALLATQSTGVTRNSRLPIHDFVFVCPINIMTLMAHRLGIYGFGNAAHLIAQVALYQDRQLFAFTRPGDKETQQAARRLGALWAGGSDEIPPEKLDAAIIFASVGELVPVALRALAKGGIVVCGGIHMSDIPSFPYADLWGERVICSVANLTRRDGEEFFEIASHVPVRTEIEIFPLEEANSALDRFRTGKLKGTAVLLMSSA